jgi:acetate kinase
MGTRTGDLDTGAAIYIMQKEEITKQTMNTLINKHSGMLGISGISSDMREIEKAAGEGNERAILGLDMYHYRIKKYIGAYAAALGGVDVLVLTGGIGENAPDSRKEILSGLEFMGFELDQEKNKGLRGKEAIISKDSSRTKVMVIPTNEELVIAEDTARIVQELKK